MPDSGFDDQSQRRTQIEHAASLTALNQRADQVTAAYRTIATNTTTFPERTLNLPKLREIPNVVSTESLPPQRIEALQRKLAEYKKEFEGGEIRDKALEVPDNHVLDTIAGAQQRAILLQILLTNGSLNYDIAREAFNITGERDEHWFRLNYHDIYDYAVNGGAGVSDGTGLVESDEEEYLRDVLYKRVPAIWHAARSTVEEVPADKMRPFEYISDDGKQMRARLMNQFGHEDMYTDGVVAELTETHEGVDVGAKEYVYLGHHRTDETTLGRGRPPFHTKKLGNYVKILKEPLGFISARDEDNPDAKTYWLTAESDSEDARERNSAFLEIVGTFGSLVDANRGNQQG